MTGQIIADSSGLVSLATDTDRNHAAALHFAEQLESVDGTILVPSEVFAETLNVLGKKSGHAVALNTATTILQSGIYVVVYADEQLTNAGLDLFRVQPPSVSFTDCMVMATADLYGCRDIFGFDEVFRKNGYNIPIPAKSGPKAA